MNTSHTQFGRFQMTLKPLLTMMALTVFSGSCLLAQVPASFCGGANEPGATLLIPYFQVDLEDGNGRSTLISIANRDDEGVIVRVTLWTSWGIPTYAFDAEIADRAVMSLSVRSLLVAGQLPTQSISGTGGCALQTLDAAALAAQHSGRPHPEDGLCYGSTPEASLATGFVTVDVLNQCSTTVIYPKDAGYFVADGEGLAGQRNVLWGDVILVDPGQDLAQGFAAVSLPALPEAIGSASDQVERSFYSRNATDSTDQRLPIGLAYRSRYLAGGAFDGGTDLLIWNGWSEVQVAPGPCDEGATSGTQWDGISTWVARDEAGTVIAGDNTVDNRRSQKLRVGIDLETPEPFGTLDLTWAAAFQVNGSSPPTQVEAQLWVLPLVSAQNRFSVGFRPTEIASYCPAPAL